MPVATGARRGVTLIEAVLFIAVALGLIVGGLVFYQRATLASRTAEAVRQFSAIAQETRALYKGRAFAAQLSGSNPLDTSSANQITQVLISAQAVPADMIASPSVLKNPWGGTTIVYGFEINDESTVLILSTNIPLEACTRLMSASATDAESILDTFNTNFGVPNQIAGDMHIAAVWGPSGAPGGMTLGAGGSYSRVYSPAAAANACRVGSVTLGRNIVPRTGAQSLSGGRVIAMGFRLY